MSDVYKAPEAELQEKSANGEGGSLESALAGDFKIEPIETMKQAWAMLPGMKLTFWLALIIYGVIAVVLEFALAAVLGYSPTGDTFGIMNLIGSIISMAVLAPFAAGLYMIAIKHSAGVKTEVGEIFKYFHKIAPLFIAMLLMYVLIIIGFVLLIIPGIYLSVCFGFVLFLVVEKDMSPIEALKTSRKVVHQQWFQTFGLFLLSGLICLLGALALVVGLIWAIPLAGLTFALVYKNVFGIEEKTLNS